MKGCPVTSPIIFHLKKIRNLKKLICVAGSPGVEAVRVGTFLQRENTKREGEGGGHLVETGLPQHHHEPQLGHGTLPGEAVKPQ